MPIFRVKSVKIYTGQKKFTRIYSWRSWQIWGMCISYYVSQDSVMVMLNLLSNKRISWKVIKSNVTKEGEVENRCWQQLLLVLAAARQKAAKTCSKALRPAPAWTLTRCLSTLIPTFAMDLSVLWSGTHCWMIWYSFSWLCLRNDFFRREHMLRVFAMKPELFFHFGTAHGVWSLNNYLHGISKSPSRPVVSGVSNCGCVKKWQISGRSPPSPLSTRGLFPFHSNPFRNFENGIIHSSSWFWILKSPSRF